MSSGFGGFDIVLPVVRGLSECHGVQHRKRSGSRSLRQFVSFLFGSYLNFYNTWSVIYGSLGAVIILLLWFYLSGMTILIGGEVNATIEQAAARSGALKRKQRLVND